MSALRLLCSAAAVLLSAAAFAGPPPPPPPAPPAHAHAAAKAAPAPPAAPAWVAQGAFLGVSTTTMSPELRGFFGAPDDRGVLVDRVEPDSAAARAGVRVGDVLVAVDGEEIEHTIALVHAVRGHEPGEKVRLELVREKRPLTLEATLGETDLARKVVRVERSHGRAGDGPLVDCPEGCIGIAIDPEWAERLAAEIERGFNRPELQEHLRAYERVRPELEERLREMEEKLRQMEEKLRATEKEVGRK